MRNIHIIALIITFLLNGCGSVTSSPAAQLPITPPTQAGTLQTTSQVVPGKISAAGVLRVGSQETYVPAEFREEDSIELTGFTVDLLKEITRRWGVGLEYVHAEYAALIPGLDADRFDMGSGGMSPNPDRLEAVDMVGYFQSGAVFLVTKENGAGYGPNATAQDFCGRKVGAIQGATTIAAAIEVENKQCKVEGKAQIDLQYFTTTPDGLHQLTLGRIDAYLPDMAQALYIIKINPDEYSLIGTNYHLVMYPITWTFKKGADTILRDAVVQTLTDMMTDGTYMTILEKWGVAAGALNHPAVNSLSAGQ